VHGTKNSTALKSLGFTLSDHSIYVRNSSEGLIIVGVYVDDLTIAAANVDTSLQDRDVETIRDEGSWGSFLACRSNEIDPHEHFTSARSRTSTLYLNDLICLDASQPSRHFVRRQSCLCARKVRRRLIKARYLNSWLAHVCHAWYST